MWDTANVKLVFSLTALALMSDDPEADILKYANERAAAHVLTCRSAQVRLRGFGVAPISRKIAFIFFL